MTKKMLIDASHPEETRVVIVDGNRVEELDFESRNKRQLRGNVYLARVTRVEPSLQAAFIEYGGNRHGFLAFSEIHPDYYQIPYEDRMALIEDEEADAAEIEKEAEEEAEKPKRGRRRKASSAKSKSKDMDDDDADDEDLDDEDESDDDEDEDDRDENLDPDENDAKDADDAEVAEEQVKVASTRRKRQSRRRYKIQEVVKRGQILLVQAVKEERGNKGAAMTTYLSLAGRYCVLMPNTPRGGGISRKIANGSDRKRLKTIMSGLDVPQGMGVIVRTAGAKRNKTEIQRDYDYLSRLWSDIRESTLKSIAPALIHEEGNLVKRSIRDLYNKDIEEVLVEGAEAYKTAKAFIKMLMPSHAKYIKEYKEDIPLFLRYGVERQIEASLDSVVQLKSGGYLVIHPTEALVSVDVNSGRSTKERNVERTALRTNLEAAEEVARQMRLRDLAGLIVIDFIDMDENKNNRAVEKKMKEALERDRARIQTSRISQFGLMEISRQRRRRSLLEGSTAHCEHCSGVGRKRTIESSALAAIRAVEEIGVRGAAKRIRLKTSPDVALYLFNEKRNLLAHVEQNSDVFTEILGDEDMIRPAYEIEVIEKRGGNTVDPLDEIEKEFRRQRNQPKKARKPDPEDEDEADDSDDKSEKSNRSDSSDEDRKSGKRRSRRGRRGGRGRDRRKENAEDGSEEQAEAKSADNSNEASDNDNSSRGSDDKPKRGRRRKAPSRNKSDDAPEVKADETEAKQIEDDKPSKPSRPGRRKAPSRKTSETDTADAKPKRTRKAPAKKAPADNSSEETPAKAVAKTSTRRRKAPTKTSDSASEDAPKPAAKKRAPAKKKAPAKTAAKDAEDAPKKAPTRRKAAPKKATAKVEADAPAAEEKPKRTRKAPVKKAAPARKAAPAKKTAPKAKAAPKADAPKAETAKPETPKAEPKAETVRTRPGTRKAPGNPSKDSASSDDKPKKKKGWWNRLTSGE
ncbi:Rne/Rng family ribonuclease [Litorimonas sp. RW-G-Af-16]|uniref:Rne/Rng family ribonuclease n=1 Tax=Litorimonas sp. RW-G-Af-16 TaxID=3241168 RepID=UPI00390C9FB7